MLINPEALIGRRVPAADGGDYGHLIVGYDDGSEEYLVIQIRWSTGEPLYPNRTEPSRIDKFKARYRYQLDKAV